VLSSSVEHVVREGQEQRKGFTLIAVCQLLACRVVLLLAKNLSATKKNTEVDTYAADYIWL